MRNFNTSLLLLLISFPTQAIKREPFKAGIATGQFAILFLCGNAIADNTITKKIGKLTNIDPQDLTAGSLLATVLWGSSYVTTNQQTRTFLRAFALTPPIVSLLIPKKVWPKIAHIPILRQYFIMCSYLGYIPLGSFNTCSNKNCEGICNQCKIRRLYQSVPFAYGIYKAGQWAHHKLFPTEFEKEAKKSLIGKQCGICFCTYTADQKPIILDCLHNMCRNCIKQTFFQHTQVETAQVLITKQDENTTEVTTELGTVTHENFSCRCKDCNPICPHCREKVNTDKLMTQVF